MVAAAADKSITKRREAKAETKSTNKKLACSKLKGKTLSAPHAQLKKLGCPAKRSRWVEEFTQPPL